MIKNNIGRIIIFLLLAGCVNQKILRPYSSDNCQKACLNLIIHGCGYDSFDQELDCEAACGQNLINNKVSMADVVCLQYADNCVAARGCINK